MTVCAWLFDVDGTLTPSRASMDPTFAAWFLQFARHNPVCLVSGSDQAKSLEQLGPAIVHALHTSYNCLGNSVWRQGSELYCRAFTLPAQAEAFLLRWREASGYPIRLGLPLEARPGMLNFSVVGRAADAQQRADYAAWDRVHQERRALAAAFEAHFPALSCQVAGESGVDIYARGQDKAQVLQELAGPVRFFGDSMYPGGNDYPLAQAIAQRTDGSVAHPVAGWRHTWDLLQQYAEAGVLTLG